MGNKTYINVVISILGGIIGSSANTVFDNSFTIMNGIIIGVCAIIICGILIINKEIKNEEVNK